MTGRQRIKIIRIQSRICIGGPAIHSEILSRHMPNTKYETLLIGGSLQKGEYSRYEELRKKGIRITVLNEMKRNYHLINDIRSIFKLYNLIKKEKPDIVETHTAKAGAVGRLAAYFARVQIITHTFHGHVFENYFIKVVTKVIIFIERLLAKISTRIIVLSERQYEDIVHKFKISKPNKTELIPLGIEIEEFLKIEKNGLLKKELNIPSKNFLIAVIGRIVAIKNFEMVFRVLKKLRNDGLNIHLCVVGDGELKEKYEKQEENEANHFLGWIPDIHSVYAGIDVIVLASFNEGTPLTIIEAMASKVPVVATKVGGVPDLIKQGGTGYICEVNDDEKMAQSIKLLLTNNGEKKRITNNAQKFIKENFSYQRLIRDMENLYEELIYVNKNNCCF